MMFRVYTLTTANPKMRLGFGSRGSLFAEGTFGGGSLRLYPVGEDDVTKLPVTSTSSLGDAIDGTTVKSMDIPAGAYDLVLEGSTAATVRVYLNEQNLKVS